MNISQIPPAELFFDPDQKTLYGLQVKLKKRIPECDYPLWHSLIGKSNRGEFPLVVVREYFLKRGYKVLWSDSSRESSETFICTSFPGLRRERPLHPAYERMTKFFTLEQLENFNTIAEEAKTKRKHGRNKGGGDPDLFVYMENDPRNGFFVEVKHKDKPHTNQKIVFPLIEKHLGCPVYLIHIYPTKAQS